MLALVVMENPLLRKALVIMLVALGAKRTMSAAAYAAGRELMAASRPQLLIIDGRLPEADVLHLTVEAALARPSIVSVVLAAPTAQRAVLQAAGARLVAVDDAPAAWFFGEMQRLMAGRDLQS